MRRIVVAVLSLTLAIGAFAVVGCSSGSQSSSSSSADEVQYVDEDFIASLAKGLEARWDLIDQSPNTGQQSIKELQSCIQAELDELTQYETATFKDTKLQEKALRYINVLKDSYDNANYNLSDKDYDKWQKYVDERSVLIKSFVEDYGLTVDEKYQATLDEFIANGKAVETQETQKDAIDGVVKSLNFELVQDDGYGWKTYEAILDNTTEYDIVQLLLDVSLLDNDGVIIETAYASADNVKQGQKAKLEFQTDADFSKLELTVNYFEVK